MFELVEGEQGATLIVSGDVTIQNAASFRDALLEWVEKSAPLHLDLGGVTDADLTSLQLICSAHRFMMDTNKILNRAGKLSEPLIKAAREAGFVREQGCRGGESKNCVWIITDEGEK